MKVVSFNLRVGTRWRPYVRVNNPETCPASFVAPRCHSVFDFLFICCPLSGISRLGGVSTPNFHDSKSPASFYKRGDLFRTSRAATSIYLLPGWGIKICPTMSISMRWEGAEVTEQKQHILSQKHLCKKFWLGSKRIQKKQRIEWSRGAAYISYVGIEGIPITR